MLFELYFLCRPAEMCQQCTTFFVNGVSLMKLRLEKVKINPCVKFENDNKSVGHCTALQVTSNPIKSGIGILIPTFVQNGFTP